MEENYDKPMDTEKEIGEHQERNPDADEQIQTETEILSHQDIARPSCNNSRKDQEVKNFSKNKITLAYWIMIALVILTCCYVVYYLSSNSASCLADPLQFYAEKIDKQCYCINKFALTP